MKKQDYWKKSEDMEIDLRQLLKDFFIHWKKIAVCALVSAVIFTGYSYLRNQTGTADVTQEQTLDEIELSEEEKESAVSAAVLAKEIYELEEYMNHSILMQADPYHKNKVTMLFSIEQARRRELQKITESYLSFLTNGGAADALKKSDHETWKIDKNYLTEAVTAYQKTFNLSYMAAVDYAENENLSFESMICVEVTGSDAGMADEMAKDVHAALKNYSDTVKNTAGNHKLVFISSQENIQTDTGLQSQQRDKRAQLTADRANLKAMTDAFSKEQMKMYKELSATQDEQEEPETDINNMTGSTGVSMKSALYGAGIGVLLSCAIFLCWYLLQDTIKSAEEMKELYTFPVYGGICLKKAGCQGNSGGQEKEQILNRIRLACKKRAVRKLYMVSDFSFDDQEMECVESMQKWLKDCELEMKVCENAGKNIGCWDDLAQTGNILLVCRAGKTTHRIIDEAMRFYQENDIAVIGAMVFI